MCVLLILSNTEDYIINTDMCIICLTKKQQQQYLEHTTKTYLAQNLQKTRSHT